MAQTASSNSSIPAKIVVRIESLSRNDRQKTQRPIILKAYQERMSLRNIARTFGVHRQSISRWIVGHVQNLPKLKDTLLPVKPDDV